MFRKNSTVCFLGDSITSNGGWIYEIYDYFKADRLKIFNCGRSGAGVAEMTHCINEECFIHSPDYIVIMLGMNDVNSRVYAPSYTLPDKEELQKSALDGYRENMHKLYDVCENYGAEIILCSTTAYDDKGDLEGENRMCNGGLSKIAEIVRDLSEEKCCKFIDFHTPMSALAGKEIFTDFDRTHPNAHGNHIMAQIFLKAVGRIDKEDFRGEYTYSKELQALFDVSDILRGIAFTERSADIANALENNLSIQNRKEIIRKKYETEPDKSMYVPRMYKIYIDSIDYKADYEKLYIKKMMDFLNA